MCFHFIPPNWLSCFQNKYLWIINNIIPVSYTHLFHQSFPAWSCANLQVSIFIIDILVRYPTTPLIFFGQCFHIILPAIIIIAGIRQSHIKINHQNHILFSPQIHNLFKKLLHSVSCMPVSYTHLDVYKRQVLYIISLQIIYGVWIFTRSFAFFISSPSWYQTTGSLGPVWIGFDLSLIHI